MKKRIFISYKRSDKKRVFLIKNDIEKHIDESCWIDLDGIESHAQFVNVIIKAIDEADIFLFMYSKRHANIVDYENDWSVREINYAQEEGKKIIFLNIDGSPLSKWFKMMFGLKQQIDANSKEAMNKLYVDLKKYLQKEDVQIVENSLKIYSKWIKFVIPIILFVLFIIGIIGYSFIKKGDNMSEVKEEPMVADTFKIQIDTLSAIPVSHTAILSEALNVIEPDTIAVSAKKENLQLKSKKKIVTKKNNKKVDSKIFNLKDTITLDLDGLKKLVTQLSLDEKLELVKVLSEYINSQQIEKASDSIYAWIKNGELDSTKFYIKDVARKIVFPDNLEFNILDVKFNMVLVKGGSFERSIISEEVDSVGNIKQIETIEVVELEDFYIADTEVTQALWKAVMSVDIYQQRANRSWPTCGVGDNYPMYFVSFRDCEKFIKKLNKILKKQIESKQIINEVFSLPNDVQWTFAAHGGIKSRGYNYAGSRYIKDVAWFYDNSNFRTHEVASKGANELGLYDMSGNVSEWCYFYDGVHYNVDDYECLVCGGSYASQRKECEVEAQDIKLSQYSYSDIGFRLVLKCPTNK